MKQDEPQWTPAVGAAVLGADSRVLLVRRANPPRAGEWSLIGGRIEQGESPEAAVVREVCEECAIEVRIVADLGVVRVEREGFGYAIREFACVPAHRGDVPRAGDDAVDLRWAAFDELASLGLTEEAIDVVGRALGALRGSGAAPPETRLERPPALGGHRSGGKHV